MIKHIVWLLGVIAAGLAVITNAIVMADFNRLQKTVTQLQYEVYSTEDELHMTKHYLDVVAENYGELQAQVQFGLHERYDVEVK